MRLHRRSGFLAGGLDQRLVAGAPAQLARQLGERRLAARERGLEAIQHAAQLLALAVVGLLEASR